MNEVAFQILVNLLKEQFYLWICVFSPWQKYLTYICKKIMGKLNLHTYMYFYAQRISTINNYMYWEILGLKLMFVLFKIIHKKNIVIK